MKDMKGDLILNKDELELSKLMRKAQEGDSESYRRALLKMRDMLTGYIRNSFRRCRIPAESGSEDVLQEILLAIHQKRETYDPSQFFLPWMYAIARYKIIDHLRRSQVQDRLTMPLSSFLDDELQTVEGLLFFEAGLDVERLMALLPAKQKEVLQLVKVEGLSLEEASQRSGYSVSDIKVTVHRAIKSLQSEVGEVSRENR